MFCNQCGDELSKESLFCSTCGNKISRTPKKSQRPKIHAYDHLPDHHSESFTEKHSMLIIQVLKYTRVFLYISLYIVSFFSIAALVEVLQIFPGGIKISTKEFIFVFCYLFANIFLIRLTHKRYQISYSKKEIKAFSGLGKINYFFAIVMGLTVFNKNGTPVDVVLVAQIFVFVLWGAALTNYSKKN